jgi:hypothetical protein
LLEHCGLQRSQHRSRFYAHLVGQPSSERRARPQCFGLSATPVQGEHALEAQPLPQRVTDHEPVQLRRHGVMQPARQLGVDAILDRTQSRLVQASRLGFEARAHLHVREWLAPPQGQRLTQRRRCSCRIGGVGLTTCPLDEREEAILVDVVRRNGELVSGRHELQQRSCIGGIQHLAHGGHADLQHAASPVGGEVRPELIHEPLGAHHATVVDHEQCEERRSFCGRGVTSTPSVTAESGPRTLKATSTTADPRDPAAARERSVTAA